MSSIIGGMSQISDFQSQIWQMYNKINNATINEGQKHSIETEVSGEDFIRNLEAQLEKEKQEVFGSEKFFMQDEKLGMPAGLNITEVGAPEESYQSIINSLMESMMDNLNKNPQDNLSKAPSTETTGSLAFSKTNYIQKLIDSYKDKA